MQRFFQCKDEGREQKKRVVKRLIKDQVMSHKTSGTGKKKQQKAYRKKKE